MTIWQGGEPYGLQLPLMLDDYAERGSVERAVRVLEPARPRRRRLRARRRRNRRRAAARRRMGDRIDSTTATRSATHRRPAPAAAAGHAHAARIRAARVRAAAPARARQAERRKTKVVTVKKGDTPAKIARRVQVQMDGATRAQPRRDQEGESEAVEPQRRQVQGRHEATGARQDAARHEGPGQGRPRAAPAGRHRRARRGTTRWRRAPEARPSPSGRSSSSAGGSS